MPHLEEGTIHAWLDRAVTGDEGARVEQHLAECAECTAMVAEARGLIAGASRVVASLDIVRGGVIPRPAVARRGSSLWRALRITPARAALAASLMVAAATLLSVRHDTPDKIVPAASSMPSVPQTPAVSPAAPPAASSVTSPAPTRAPAPKSAPKSIPPVAPVAAETKATTAMSRVAAVDSAQAVVPNQLRATVSGFAAQQNRGRRVLAGVTPLQDVVTTGVAALSGTGFAGCYAITADSTGWPRSLPSRFSLATPESASAGAATQQVVRAVNAQGRVDSVIAGGSWTQPSPNVAHVSFAVENSRQLLTLQLLPNGAVTAKASANASARERAEPIPIVREECRP
jgi:hypothetical protein